MMAVSHQSGTILHHWNDAPSTIFSSKTSSPAASTVSLGIPTPPATPSQENNEALVCGLNGILAMPTTLAGRNKEMIFAKIRTLIKSLQEQRIPGSQIIGLEGILQEVEKGEKAIARERMIKMMSEERGIAAWGTAFRMIIENLLL